jgi:hypothetical protein
MGICHTTSTAIPTIATEADTSLVRIFPPMLIVVTDAHQSIPSPYKYVCQMYQLQCLNVPRGPCGLAFMRTRSHCRDLIVVLDDGQERVLQLSPIEFMQTARQQTGGDKLSLVLHKTSTSVRHEYRLLLQNDHTDGWDDIWYDSISDKKLGGLLANHFHPGGFEKPNVSEGDLERVSKTL